jgi:hypothetical protein
MCDDMKVEGYTRVDMMRTHVDNCTDEAETRKQGRMKYLMA